MADTIDTSKVDRLAVIGVNPYSDGSGFEYTVSAECKDGGGVVRVSDATSTIVFDADYARFLIEAIEAAIKFARTVGGDR